MKAAKRSLAGLTAMTAMITIASSFLCIAQVAQPNLATPHTLTLPRQLQTGYAKLPLAFELNKGQTDPAVQFFSRGAGYSVFLTSGGMVLSWHPTTPAIPLASADTYSPGSAAIATKGVGPNKTADNKSGDITMVFNLVGAASHPKAVGEDQLATKVNYFIGNDPAKWQTNVKTYARIRYKNVYPGIDLLYHGNNRQVEFDFVVAPGADPGAIQFAVKGADALTVDAEGNLVLTKGGKQLHFQAPGIYQEINGSRVKVAGNYSLKDSTHVGFTVLPHDNSKVLVIDPVLVYSTFLGGSGYDNGNAIAVDSTGAAYVTGTTNSPDFPLALTGNFDPNQQRIFLVKLNPSGSTLLYADYFGGTSGNDSPFSIAVDSNGSAYVTGFAYSTDFSVVNAFQPTLAGSVNAFLTKFSADGSSLVYSTYLGGSRGDFAQSIGVDDAGEATIAGSATSRNFPLANAYQSSILPDQNSQWGAYSFFSRFSADGSSLIYSSYLAGNLDQDCHNYNDCGPNTDITGLTLDSSGNLYVVGSTNTTNFPTTSGAFMTTYPGASNNYIPFISKFDTSGAIVYSSYFGGSGDADASAVAVDSTGSAYVTGYDQGSDSFPITATTICNPNTQNCNGIVVTKFNPTGSTLTYSTYLGENNNSTGAAIQVDTNGDAYILAADYSSGQYTEVNPIEGYLGGSDMLIVEIDPVASTQLFATYLGGTVYDYPTGMVVDNSGAIYVTGGTQSPDFPVTQSAVQGLFGGQADAFILKIGPANAPGVSIQPSLLQFSVVDVGTTSSPMSAILRNMGSAPLTIASKTVAGDFAETDDCGTSVAAASFCTFSVTFSPTVPGSSVGTISLADDAAGSPHRINLAGDGFSDAGFASISPSSLTFGAAMVGTTSTPQTITVTNTGNSPLTISQVLASGDFAVVNNNCTSVAANATCTLQVTFSATASGSRTGTVTFTDSAANSPQIVNLTGSGIDFSMSSGGSATIQAGATATYSVAVTSVGGTFSNQVNLTCGTVPAYSVCTINPTSVIPGAGNAAVTVAIKTTGTAASLHDPGAATRPLFASWTLTTGIGLLATFLCGSRRRKRAGMLLLTIALIAGVLVCIGCQGLGSPAQGTSTPPGTYTVLVTGTSGSARHVSSLSLVVQ